MAEAHVHGPEEVLCRDFVELATDLLEGALPDERLVLVEEHLIMCDWCLDYLRQVEATVAALPGAAAEPEPVPAATEQALLGAFRAWREER
jgi:predicted anti-sigma-YlaC factor YlaD